MGTMCKTCGGPVNRVGNHYVCEYCRNKWEIDSSNDIHAVERANAWSALRDGDFEKSSQLFEEIILKESDNHEAYWGRALALAGIVYVTDMSENKKVPTCNNITEDSFINNSDVKKAISLAPSDIAESYNKQADYIEKVRVEWLEKASKEPAYDVFISFKDSDRENGLERTQDSIDAQDLYNALVAEGYKVFFSRISLRDKISEQYEPYIYNAIKTAKVMIVFGEKAEYFSSVWIKNEWSRFKTRIEKGEKHKNSLVVVYKNMNPGDLPIVLKSRQCLNATDITFLSDLNRHIKRVVDESKKNVQLERIEITGGQISKKATTLYINSVETREVGQGAIAETDITEHESVNLSRMYLSQEQWDEANRLIDDVLFSNPSCAEAIWCKLMAKHRATNEMELVKHLNGFSDDDFRMIEKVINCASKEFAEKILTLLYESENNITSVTYKKVLEIILPFKFEGRQSKIDNAFKGVIKNSKCDCFNLLLNTLNSDDVDKYINYNYDYAMKTTLISEKKVCLNNIINVDEGNLSSLRAIVKIDLEYSSSLEEITKNFEELLKYTSDVEKEIDECLNWLCNSIKKPVQCLVAKKMLCYYKSEISQHKEQLISLSYKIIKEQMFKEAEYFLNLVLSFDANNPEVYWAICLMKVEASNENEIVNKENLLKDVAEFNKYLVLVSDERKKKCIAISKEQIKKQEEVKKKEEQQRHQEKVKLKEKKKQESTALKIEINKIKSKDNSEKLLAYLYVFFILIGICAIYICFVAGAEDYAGFFMLGIMGIILGGYGIMNERKNYLKRKNIKKEMEHKISELEEEIKKLDI